MNKNQAKGAAKVAEGKLLRQSGKMTGNKKQKVKGAVKLLKGRVLTRIGDVQAALKESRKRKSK